jgi:hypothetical protein
MTRMLLAAIAVFLISCNNNSASGDNSSDSVSTDSLQSPSYNPKTEADSAAKQMNIDSPGVRN